MKTKMTCLLIGLLGMAVLVSPGAEAANKPRYQKVAVKVITHNIAGGAMHLGSWEALRTVEAQIKRRSPDLVMMQEVCSSQVDAFKRWHPDWTVVATQIRYSQPKCDGDPTTIEDPDPGYITGDELYDVVATPHRVLDQGAVRLQEESHSRRQHLTCAKVKIRWATAWGCTTHIKVGWAEEQAVELGGMESGQQKRQIQRVAWWGRQFAQDSPVLIGGDFNARPDSEMLAPMWASYSEVLGKRPPRRIDYIWGRGVRNPRGELVRQTASDHPLLRGVAIVRRKR